MNLEDFIKLYQQIMENNSWKAMLKNYLEDAGKRPMIKYIQFCIDTRDGDIYSLVVEPFAKDAKRYRLDDEKDVVALQAYLKGEETC